MNRPSPSWGGDPVPKPSIDAIRDAAKRIANIAVRTPTLPYLGTAPEIALKLETLQPIGSFKLRGVYNWAASLSDAERAKGICTTSAGNTAQALGYVARHFGIPSKTLLPETVPDAKLNAITAYGVEPVKVTVEKLFAYMLEEEWRQEPYQYLNPWGEPDMIAGSGTVALEILEDVEIDTVFVAVGGGGLAAGVGSAIKAIKPSVRVLAVQPEGCPALKESFDRGEGVWVTPADTICDGTKVPLIVSEMYPLLRDVINDVIIVPETRVREAIRELVLKNKVVAEGSGALALAGALHMDVSKRGRAACVISGGSIDPVVLAGILQTSD
jgi:threonine dehydratase